MDTLPPTIAREDVCAAVFVPFDTQSDPTNQGPNQRRLNEAYYNKHNGTLQFLTYCGEQRNQLYRVYKESPSLTHTLFVPPFALALAHAQSLSKYINIYILYDTICIDSLCALAKSSGQDAVEQVVFASRVGHGWYEQ